MHQINILTPLIKSFILKDDGTFPNNEKLPLLLYKSCTDLPSSNAAEAIEYLLNKNKWKNSWRNGIFDYHHYHSITHEVLLCYSGWATVKMGGQDGVSLDFNMGDMIIIPAGVSHKCEDSSHDFKCIGAYPGGSDYDIKKGESGERPEADMNIKNVPLPDSDPLSPSNGWLFTYWK